MFFGRREIAWNTRQKAIRRSGLPSLQCNMAFRLAARRMRVYDILVNER